MSGTRILLLDLGRAMRGGQRQVLYLAKTLLDSEFDPVLACPDGPLAEAALAAEVPVDILPPRLWRPDLWTRLWTLAGKTDLVHTHDAQAATAGAVLKRFFPRLRLVHSRRVSYPLKSGLRRWKYAVADAVVGVSADITEGLLRSGLEPDRLHTVHSGIDPDTYSKAVPLEASPAGADGVPTFVFLAVGALTPQKGFEVLLDAAARLNKENLPPWRLRLVGDGELRGALLARRARLGLENRVDMPGRRESRSELPLAHALVVPSVNGEGSSGTIKEGWASSLPVIASDLASNRELVQHEISGLLSVVGSADSLAHAMRRVLEDQPLRAALIDGGDHALPVFTARRMAESTLDLYRTLL